jgi:shikimate dehydrogenase
VIYDYNDIRILGLIGHPLGHSFSPLLHNVAIKNKGLNYVYLNFDVDFKFLSEAINGLRVLNFRGLNVTIPYKEVIIPMLDKLDPLAEEIGAVNTIVNDEGVLKGYNTDVYGFKTMLEEDGGYKIKGGKALIIGSGGASKAVVTTLCRNDIEEIYIFNRTLKKAIKMAYLWNEKYPDIKIRPYELSDKNYESIIDKINLLVDTTSVGMYPDINAEPVIKADYLHDGLLVVDLVYNPSETGLIKEAKKVGAKTLNGIGMLLYQGAESFKLWTNNEIDISLWRNIIDIHH